MASPSQYCTCITTKNKWPPLPSIVHALLQRISDLPPLPSIVHALPQRISDLPLPTPFYPFTQIERSPVCTQPVPFQYNTTIMTFPSQHYNYFHFPPNTNRPYMYMYIKVDLPLKVLQCSTKQPLNYIGIIHAASIHIVAGWWRSTLDTTNHVTITSHTSSVSQLLLWTTALNKSAAPHPTMIHGAIIGMCEVASAPMERDKISFSSQCEFAISTIGDLFPYKYTQGDVAALSQQSKIPPLLIQQTPDTCTCHISQQQGNADITCCRTEDWTLK